MTTRRLSPNAFAPYGAVVQPPAGPPTASGRTFRFWSDLAHYGVEGPTEIGLCTALRAPDPCVDWMERHHHTPEVLVPIDAPILLPVMGEDGRVEGFHVTPGEAVVLDAGVWHSAALPAGTETATYFVLFRRGTPAEDVEKRSIDPTRP